MEFVIPVLIVILVVAIVLAFMSVRVAREYERGVVFRFGRLIDLRGPGLFLIIPFGIDRLFKIDLRTITLEVQPQEVITKDNVTIKVRAVVWFQVIDPRVAVTKVANYYQATTQVAETTLRGTIGQHELDELLAHRDRINASLKEVIDRQTEPWGIQVTIVEVKERDTRGVWAPPVSAFLSASVNLFLVHPVELAVEDLRYPERSARRAAGPVARRARAIRGPVPGAAIRTARSSSRRSHEHHGGAACRGGWAARTAYRHGPRDGVHPRLLP